MTKINQERDDALILQMPKKTHLSSDSRNQVAVGCVVIKDVTYCKKSPQEGELQAAAEAVYGRSLTHLDLYLGRKPVLTAIK